MFLITSTEDHGITSINIECFDVIEVYKHDDKDFRICVRRFQLDTNDPIKTSDDGRPEDTNVRDISLTIARYRSINEAVSAFSNIMEFINTGAKTVYIMPRDDTSGASPQDSAGSAGDITDDIGSENVSDYLKHMDIDSKNNKSD